MEKLMSSAIRYLAIMILLASADLRAEAMCQLKQLASVSASHPECLFYSGTSAFRDEDYQRAAKSWKKLVGLKSAPVEFEHLKVSAYNNLGYLYFFGHGVKPNKKAAIAYWAYATKSGSEEAPYHLCHAYAESKEPTYDPKTAIGYCREALRRYGLMKAKDGDIEKIVGQLKNYIRKLEQH
jgi:TPR repeat protein